MEENYKLKIVVTEETTKIEGEGTLMDYGEYLLCIGGSLAKEIKEQDEKAYLISYFINGFSDNASQALEITESILEVFKKYKSKVEDNRKLN